MSLTDFGTQTEEQNDLFFAVSSPFTLQHQSQQVLVLDLMTMSTMQSKALLMYIYHQLSREWDQDKSYHLDESVTETFQENDGGIVGDRKLIVFKSWLLLLFWRCHSCGLEVKLKVSTVGKMLVVDGKGPTTLAVTVNSRLYASW